MINTGAQITCIFAPLSFVRIKSSLGAAVRCMESGSSSTGQRHRRPRCSVDADVEVISLRD
jgi:hypothetical protein